MTMSRSNHLLAALPPAPRTLWPDPPQQLPMPHSMDLTQPEVRLPWAQSPVQLRRTEKPTAAETAKMVAPAAAVVLGDHLSLAVALDVLATEVAPLEANEAVLSTITDALLATRQCRPDPDGLSGDAAEQTGALMRNIALGPIGEARAALAEPLSACTQALGDASDAWIGVVQACAHLTQGAQQVIALAVLALDAQNQRGRHNGR